MLHQYLSQILTMDLLADSVCIIDDKGIIQYFKRYKKDDVPFLPENIVGKHFMTAFHGITPEESTVLKALNGKSFYNSKTNYIDESGKYYEVLESIYPIRLNKNIIGVVCIARRLKSNGREIELSAINLDDESADIEDIIGRSPAITQLKQQILDVAKADTNILIYGETGTGKELVAKALFRSGTRKQGTFYSQNCAAIPESLLESLFFGTVKGAFTGAVNRKGILEQVDGGVLFLDEINSLDLSIQAKLLKALEEKSFRPLGANRETAADFRIIAATNEEPFDCVKNGKIRKDLFFRIGTVILEVPPLRNRKEDIPLLADYFIGEYNKKNAGQISGVSGQVLNLFTQYDWPGNVRELKNVLESAIIFSRDSMIREENLPQYFLNQTKGTEGYTVNPPVPAFIPDTKNDPDKEIDFLTSHTLAQIEAEVIRLHLQKGDTHTHIAKELGITRQTLLAKIKKYKINET